MKGSNYYSLRTEIVINILILMGVAIATVGIMVIKIFENNVVAMRSADGEILVSYLQRTIEDNHVKNGKFVLGGLQHTITAFAEQSKASDVVVVDKQYTLLGHTGSKQIDAFAVEDDFKNAVKLNLKLTKVEEKSSSFFFTHYENITFFSPIVFKGKHIGGIMTVFPLAKMNNLLLRVKLLVLIFLLFDSALLLIFGNFLLSRIVVKPLKKILKAAERVAGGDLSHRIDYQSRNEIGQLSVTFNTMAGTLEEHVGYLERVNRDLKNAQQELINSEKLASVGRLAAGVAHEVGNPLGAILGYTGMLIRGVKDEETQSDFLKRIEKEIKKIDDIIKELLDYSRPTQLDIKKVAVNTVIKETISFLSHQKNFVKIDLTMKLDETIPLVMADGNQLQQVLMNIILNSVDAIKEDGRLDIISSLFTPKGGTLHHRRRNDEERQDIVRQVEKQVQITLKDNGSGIKNEDLNHIFDPFFTTKDPGKGTGLGLSISQRIIETFNGRLEVKSEWGKGTTFIISLPVAKS